jgi:hypothetical protein
MLCLSVARDTTGRKGRNKLVAGLLHRAVRMKCISSEVINAVRCNKW